MITKLITVANYAKSKSVSTTWVYKLIKAGKLNSQTIDGVKFVEVILL